MLNDLDLSPHHLHSKPLVISALKLSTVNTLIWGCRWDDDQENGAHYYNDIFVTLGYKKAMARKIEGLGEKRDGYDHNPQAAIALNEELITKGDREAIERT